MEKKSNLTFMVTISIKKTGNTQQFSIYTFGARSIKGMTTVRFLRMEPYVFNANAAKAAQVLNGDGLDKYIYNAQDGHGIGGFFSSIYKVIVPIVKTIGRTLLGAAKPAARAAGREAIKGMATAGLSSLTKKTIESVKRKRKNKHLSRKRRDKFV